MSEGTAVHLFAEEFYETLADFDLRKIYLEAKGGN